MCRRTKKNENPHTTKQYGSECRYAHFYKSKNKLNQAISSSRPGIEREQPNANHLTRILQREKKRKEWPDPKSPQKHSTNPDLTKALKTNPNRSEKKQQERSSEPPEHKDSQQFQARENEP